jgi:uncharacterized membrane protein YvlD (DUF360 family)
MTLEFFTSILVISAAATSIAIEILKDLLNKFNIKYQTLSVATATAFIIGVIEVLIYSINTGFSYITIIYAICMGIANVIGSNVGYDKAKQLICALFSNAK